MPEPLALYCLVIGRLRLVQLAAKLQTVSSLIGLKEINDMRQAGGTLGQVTEREWPKIESAKGNLSISQDPDLLRANMEEVQAIFDIMINGNEAELRALGDRDVTQRAILRRSRERAARRAGTAGTPGAPGANWSSYGRSRLRKVQ